MHFNMLSKCLSDHEIGNCPIPFKRLLHENETGLRFTYSYEEGCKKEVKSFLKYVSCNIR